jgi:hypothetical protein
MGAWLLLRPSACPGRLSARAAPGRSDVFSISASTLKHIKSATCHFTYIPMTYIKAANIRRLSIDRLKQIGVLEGIQAVDKNHAQRHQTAITQLIDLYEKIEELLSRLPLRIEVPLLQGEVYRAEVRAGLVQAVTVVGDLPMDGEARRVVCEVIVDWLIAMEFLFRDEEDEADWHLDVVQTHLRRIGIAIQVNAALFAGPTGQA